jgi:hypothetical protein
VFEATDDLGANNWTRLATAIGTGSEMEFNDTGTTGRTHRYYRIGVLVP